MTKISVGDFLEGFGEVTRVSDHFVWFGQKKYGSSRINNITSGIIYRESPDPTIDWSDPVQVDGYYSTFKHWKGVVRMGDSKRREVLHVKGNKVFYEGEYYLPYRYDSSRGLACKTTYDDGFVWGYCLKLKNNFWGHKTEATVNVFYVERLVNAEEVRYCEGKLKNRKELGDIEYIKTLNFGRINSADLDLIKKHHKELFPPGTFPYTVNNVTFEHGDFGRIEVRHRNRTGYIEVDNGYHGSQPFGNDYNAIVKVDPYFTNEIGYSSRCEGKEITFDRAMLDRLAERVVGTWDKAIESNARLWG